MNVMWDAMRTTHDSACIYFLICVIFGDFMLLNLFLAILIQVIYCILCITKWPEMLPDRGRYPGGGIQGRISVSQILCENFVCNLFGVFKDLHGYKLSYALAHVYHARRFGEL